MKYLIDFLENDDVEKSKIFAQLKCKKEEAQILRYLTNSYIEGAEDSSVAIMLKDLFGNEKYKHLEKLHLVKNLLELGWIFQSGLSQIKSADITNLSLLNSTVSLGSTFLKLLEDGNLELVLPEISSYGDHLEYLKDQFFKIELYQKLTTAKHSYTQNSPNINRLKNKLQLLESRIAERLNVTEQEILIETIFEKKGFNSKEQIIFLSLLKEEYSGEAESLRDMNMLIDLISFDDYEKIKNRALLEEGSKLIESGTIDYDEMLTAFGGVTRSFFISEDVLHKIIHPHKEKKVKKIKLDMLVKEQDIFELIEPKTTLEDVVLNPKTKEIMDNLLRQMDKRVLSLLKEWGIKEKRKGMDTRIIFYGPPGTGKTMTALSLAKSLKKRVLNFDCSKILSQYVGESEKNVRKIFDTYKDLSLQTKSEPILLLNEADQFLSSRSSATIGSADKMHNQMQNIFLEQIENFNGVLIATTNLLESIDPAFSRRFDYKVMFEKPNLKQRLLLWRKILPENAVYEEDFEIEKLAKYPLTGGQINVVIKNTALKVAVKEEPIFLLSDFESVIKKELSGAFGEEKSMGFII